MFSKTNLISTLVTFLWGFLGGYLLWGIIGDPLLEDHVVVAGLSRDIPDFAILALGCLIMGFVFSTIYSKWARGTHGISHGLKFGLGIGVFIGFGSGLIDYATANLLDFSGTIINGIIYTIHFSVMGILASLVYGKFASEG